MLIKNPSDMVIRGKSRVDGNWFDGILPGEVLDVQDPYCIRALLKHGCVQFKPKKKTKRRGSIKEA